MKTKEMPLLRTVINNNKKNARMGAFFLRFDALISANILLLKQRALSCQFAATQ